MSEVVTIEAVTNKYANKFSSGSVLTGGKWLQVSSKLDLNLFKKDSQIEVETSTNAKGYTSIVGVGGTPTVIEDLIQPAKTPKRAVTRKTETTNSGGTTTVNSYETDKNRRIQVQGIIQGCIQSPATINFGDDVPTIAAKTLELTDLLLSGMDERVG